MRIGGVLLLTGLLLSSGSQALETHADVADFVEEARHHVGRRITLDHCHLVYATEDEATCIGLSTLDAAGTVRMAGKLVIRVAATEMPGRIRAATACADGSLDAACEVSVTGEVFDASRLYGLDEARLMGLREATICWPD